MRNVSGYTSKSIVGIETGGGGGGGVFLKKKKKKKFFFFFFFFMDREGGMVGCGWG